MAKSFSQEEVDEILRRAVDEHGQSGSLSRQELIDAAREAGIGEKAVDAAIASYEGEREVEREIEVQRAQARHELWSRFATWAILAACLGALNAYLGGYPWAAWPIAALGLTVALKAKKVWLPNPAAEHRRAFKVVESRRRKREREAKRRQRANRSSLVNEGASLVEEIVEEGVRELLGALRHSKVRVDEAAHEADWAEDEAEHTSRDRRRSK